MKKRSIKRKKPSKMYQEALQDIEYLKKRNINISAFELYNYRMLAKKANIKGEKLKKDPSALYAPNFTTNVKVFESREQFKLYMQSLRKVLQPSFKQIKNEDIRQNFIDNMKANSDISEETIQLIKSLNDAQFKQFVKDNGELNSLIWGFYDEPSEKTSKLLTTVNSKTDAQIRARIENAM